MRGCLPRGQVVFLKGGLSFPLKSVTQYVSNSDILTSFWHLSVIFLIIFVIILSFCLSVFLSLCLFVFLSFCLSVIISFYLSFCLSSSHCSDQSEACIDDLEVLLGETESAWQLYCLTVKVKVTSASWNSELLALSLSLNWVISPWTVHLENTKSLTGNASKGWKVEKRSAVRVAKRFLAPVATPVGFCATLKPATQSLLRLEYI